MSDVTISVEGLSKRYRIGLREEMNDTLGGAVLGLATRPFRNLRRLRGLSRFDKDSDAVEDVIWALEDVSFNVEPGETLGIIGSNGAGKSTLLKILTRIMEPTSGKATIRGRVSSLLEVGTGFHPELTGRENVYLNGAILGMSHKEIARKFSEIVEFSGVEKFIDTAVKRYSSGMKVRLAFSVAAHLEPEVLIVDEVLAVGDVSFQRKCLGKMDDFAGEGRTVLLVSHKMEAIMGLCSRAIWLEHGRIMADGPADQVVRKYFGASSERTQNQISLAERQDRYGDGPLRFTGFRIMDIRGNPISHVLSGDTVDFVFSYSSQNQELSHVSVWFWILDGFGRRLLCLFSRLTGEDFERLPPEGELVCRIPRFPLVPGAYSIDLVTAIVNGVKADSVQDAARFEVVSGDFFGAGRSLENMGEFLCEHSWRLNESYPKREKTPSTVSSDVPA